MAVWYLGSVKYAAVTQYANLHTYSIGDIVRQLAAPAAGKKRCFRCTTGGISGAAEPTWVLTKGNTTTAGTAIFTEVTGNSTYNWTAPFGELCDLIQTWAGSGDTIYVESGHDETTNVGITSQNIGTLTSVINVWCVSSAGSVPPVAADLTTGANIRTGTSNTMSLLLQCDVRGINFHAGTGANSANITFNGSQGHITTFTNCGMYLDGTSGGNFDFSNAGFSPYQHWIFDNTTFNFTNVNQFIKLGPANLTWRNTASAIGGSVPTVLITDGGNFFSTVTADGLDLSAAGSGKTIVTAASTMLFADFTNCKIDPAATLATRPNSWGPRVTSSICDSTGTNYKQAVVDYTGTLTQEATIIRSSGASDGVTGISWKVVTTANPTFRLAFVTNEVAIWNSTTGSSVTATVEIVNDGTTLTNDDIYIRVQYLGSSGSPLASVASSGVATPLTAGASITTSTATWTTTGLTTPIKQKMAVSFTPQLAGYIRLTVYVKKASQTVYVDPLITLS